MRSGVGRRCSSDPVLLWCRLATVAPIQPLAWEFPYAMGAALKKRQNKTKIMQYVIISVRAIKYTLLLEIIDGCLAQWVRVG